MSLPDWMPPITINNDRRYCPEQVARMMRDYGLRCVKAYKASLKPVAWAYYWSDGGLCCIEASQRNAESNMVPVEVPLYRLDQP